MVNKKHIGHDKREELQQYAIVLLFIPSFLEKIKKAKHAIYALKRRLLVEEYCEEHWQIGFKAHKTLRVIQWCIDEGPLFECTDKEEVQPISDACAFLIADLDETFSDDPFEEPKTDHLLAILGNYDLNGHDTLCVKRFNERLNIEKQIKDIFEEDCATDMEQSIVEEANNLEQDAEILNINVTIYSELSQTGSDIVSNEDPDLQNGFDRLGFMIQKL